ncbi:hypothetical protein EDC04DRAFT_2803402 [Pisolithus marmoratus]|nr:hypothetical protein EDC04DRAFT_2803402 [Pisolithus marmoratus]
MQSVKTIVLNGPMVLCMGLSQDATKAAFGMADNSISLWDLEKNEVEPPHFEGGRELPLYVVWSPDGRAISSVAANATLQIWSVDDRKCMPESRRTMGPITYSPDGSFIVCPGDDGSPDVWEVPQLPANAVSTHRAVGATESDAFGGTSADLPVTNTQNAQHLRKPEGHPGQNTPSNTSGFFSRILQRLSVRGEESAVKCKNPIVVAPGTHRGALQSTHVTTTLRNPDMTDGANYESGVPSPRASVESVIPSRALCCMRRFFFFSFVSETNRGESTRVTVAMESHLP